MGRSMQHTWVQGYLEIDQVFRYYADGSTRIGFSRPAGFDLGLRNSGVHISGPEFEISGPEFLFAP